MLRAKARRVDIFTNEIRQLARDLIETMYLYRGVGLAASQIGQALQVFVANPSQERGREVVLVNPALEVSQGRLAVVEGCLSVPNVWERINRAAYVRMSGQDVAGKPLVIEAEGLLAIVLQHEFDHLQGRLFIDRLSWLRRCRVEIRMRLLERVSTVDPSTRATASLDCARDRLAGGLARDSAPRAVQSGATGLPVPRLRSGRALSNVEGPVGLHAR